LEILFSPAEYMENCYAVRVSYPYVGFDEVAPGAHDPAPRRSVYSIVAMWATHVQRMVVYEHNDDGANRIHCHIMVEGSRISKKRLQQLANDVCDLRVANPGHRASSLMSFREKDYDGNIAGYAYVTKGKYDPQYIQGWTAQEAQVWKEAWVPPAEHTKLTPDIVLWNEFNGWWNDKDNRLPFDTEVTTDLILLRVRRFLYNHRYHNFYPRKAKAERWLLVTNMCFQYHVPFPRNWAE